MTPTSNTTSTSNFRQLALAKLDWFERNPHCAYQFSWKILEEASGRDRITLWRDPDVYKRYVEVRQFLKTQAKKPLTENQKQRLNNEQRIRKLCGEMEELRVQRDHLIELVLAIYQHVGDRMETTGFDVNTFKRICDDIKNGEYNSKNRQAKISLKTPNVLNEFG